jgi:hypothetical protein
MEIGQLVTINNNCQPRDLNVISMDYCATGEKFAKGEQVIILSSEKYSCYVVLSKYGLRRIHIYAII